MSIDVVHVDLTGGIGSFHSALSIIRAVYGHCTSCSLLREASDKPSRALCQAYLYKLKACSTSRPKVARSYQHGVEVCPAGALPSIDRFRQPLLWTIDLAPKPFATGYCPADSKYCSELWTLSDFVTSNPRRGARLLLRCHPNFRRTEARNELIRRLVEGRYRVVEYVLSPSELLGIPVDRDEYYLCAELAGDVDVGRDTEHPIATSEPPPSQDKSNVAGGQESRGKDASSPASMPIRWFRARPVRKVRGRLADEPSAVSMAGAAASRSGSGSDEATGGKRSVSDKDPALYTAASAAPAICTLEAEEPAEPAPLPQFVHVVLPLHYPSGAMMARSTATGTKARTDAATCSTERADGSSTATSGGESPMDSPSSPVLATGARRCTEALPAFMLPSVSDAKMHGLDVRLVVQEADDGSNGSVEPRRGEHGDPADPSASLPLAASPEEADAASKYRHPAAPRSAVGLEAIRHPLDAPRRSAVFLGDMQLRLQDLEESAASIVGASTVSSAKVSDAGVPAAPNRAVLSSAMQRPGRASTSSASATPSASDAPLSNGTEWSSLGPTSVTASYCRQHWLDLGEWASESSSRALAAKEAGDAPSSSAPPAKSRRPKPYGTMLLPPDAAEELQRSVLPGTLLAKAPASFKYEMITPGTPAVRGLAWSYGPKKGSGRCLGSVVYTGDSSSWLRLASTALAPAGSPSSPDTAGVGDREVTESYSSTPTQAMVPASSLSADPRARCACRVLSTLEVGRLLGHTRRCVSLPDAPGSQFGRLPRMLLASEQVVTGLAEDATAPVYRDCLLVQRRHAEECGVLTQGLWSASKRAKSVSSEQKLQRFASAPSIDLLVVVLGVLLGELEIVPGTIIR